jgi:hypothetical protein
MEYNLDKVLEVHRKWYLDYFKELGYGYRYVIFDQNWPDTALGLSRSLGIAVCDAVTNAPTMIIHRNNICDVFFGYWYVYSFDIENAELATQCLLRTMKNEDTALKLGAFHDEKLLEMRNKQMKNDDRGSKEEL